MQQHPWKLRCPSHALPGAPPPPGRYDSDSLLRWASSGAVQLPSLGRELRQGLLAGEDAARAAFEAALASSSAGTGSTRGAMAAEVRGTAAAEAAGPAGAGGAAGAVGEGGEGGEARAGVLRPEQLSERQLQEAVQQLLKALGVSEHSLSVSGSASSGSPAGGAEVGGAATAEGTRGPGGVGP